MRGQLGLAIPRKDPFQIETTSPADRLAGFEVAEIPDMLTNDEGFLRKQFKIAREQFGLILFAE